MKNETAKEMIDNIKNNKDKVSNYDKIKQYTEAMQQGVKEVYQNGEFQKYLSCMSKLHSYSTRNTMLIYKQCETPSYVAGFKSWEKDFNRTVKKGEKGIKILAPTAKKSSLEKDKKDAQGQTLIDANGKPEKETVEFKKVYFLPVTVFDISQTEGDKLPTFDMRLNEKLDNFKPLYESLQEISRVPISEKNLNSQDAKEVNKIGTIDGVFVSYRSEKENIGKSEIFIEKNMSEKDKIATMVHEIVHSELHSKDSDNYVREQDRQTQEIQAEGTAYVVCACLGVESGKTSFPYLAEYSKNKDIGILVGTLEVIQKTAHQLIEKLESKLKEKTQEHDQIVDVKTPQEKKSLHEKIENISNENKDSLDSTKDFSMQTTKER